MKHTIVTLALTILALLAAAACGGASSLAGDSGDMSAVDVQDTTDAPDVQYDQADPIYDPTEDQPPPPPCAAQAVADDVCVDCDDPMFLGAFWDGRECFELWGCGCVGAGCGRGADSLDACRAAHAGCDAIRCRDTGGDWYPAQAGFCGARCGITDENPCEVATDTCDCGPGRNFAAGVGCFDDPACDNRTRCRATRGTWHPGDECICGFTCGRPNDCRACVDSCDCGPHRTFVGGKGCELDDECEAAPAEAICVRTGGTWRETGSCGNYLCGRPNTMEPCIMPGCDCGSMANFDSMQGCVFDPACVNQRVGESCWGWADSSSCRPGLVCCAYCQYGCYSCAAPCCPDSPSCMDDGCPPPPP